MKRIQLGRAEFKRLRVDRSGKKIDGIPDASGSKHSISAGQHGHRYCPGDATLDAGGYRISLQGKPYTDELGCDGHTLDNEALCCNAVLFEHDRHGLLVLVWKHFAKPSNAARNTQDKTEGADRNARKKTREH